MPNLANLPTGTLLHWRGQLVRVIARELDPNRRTGIGRVYYRVDISLRMSDGAVRWGVFYPERVPAKDVTPLD